MKLAQHIGRGLQQGFRFRRIAGYILFIQLLLATFIGILAYNYIQDSIGHTTQLMKIIDGYDHDVFQDLLLFESTGWEMIKAFSWVAIFLYLIIGPFIMGGLLKAYNEQEDHWYVFWAGGSHFYFSFLKLNLIIIACLSLVFTFLGAIGFFFAFYGLQHLLTELPTLYASALLIVLFVCAGIILISASTRAKWLILREEVKIWKAFTSGLKEVKSKLFHYLSLGLIFLLITLGFAVLINLLINNIKESGFLLVLLALGLQVVALFIRVCLRNGYYAAILMDD